MLARYIEYRASLLGEIGQGRGEDDLLPLWIYLPRHPEDLLQGQGGGELDPALSPGLIRRELLGAGCERELEPGQEPM